MSWPLHPIRFEICRHALNTPEANTAVHDFIWRPVERKKRHAKSFGAAGTQTRATRRSFMTAEALQQPADVGPTSMVQG